LTAEYAGSTVLQTRLQAPMYDTAKYGQVPTLDATATIDDNGDIAIFLVNRGGEATALTAHLRGLGQMQVLEHTCIVHDQEMETDPGECVPQQRRDARIAQDLLEVVLPAASWNVIRLKSDQ
jgi:alpha-N-arabinofuranosidase